MPVKELGKICSQVFGRGQIRLNHLGMMVDPIPTPVDFFSRCQPLHTAYNKYTAPSVSISSNFMF
jgi:hypothetical protein